MLATSMSIIWAAHVTKEGRIGEWYTPGHGTFSTIAKFLNWIKGEHNIGGLVKECHWISVDFQDEGWHTVNPEVVSFENVMERYKKVVFSINVDGEEVRFYVQSREYRRGGNNIMCRIS